MQQRMVTLDVETTGLDPRKHEIIEICAMRPLRPGEKPFVDAHPVTLMGMVPLDKMEALARSTGSAMYWRRIQPQNLEKADARAMEINGYSSEKWTGSLPWGAHIDSLTLFLGNAIFCGHHVTSDRQFIRETYRRLDMEVPGRFRTIDTMTLAWEHLVPWGLRSLSLHAICSALNISNEDEHTSFADVVRTRAAYLKLSRATWLHRLWWGLRLKWRDFRKDEAPAPSSSALESTRHAHESTAA
jgi:DNA polymerase III epsilon subunit-like protein